jgi:NADPH2:quinone reductase
MTERMQAWQVTGAGEPADVLHRVEVDLPEPGPGQARIRVTAAGIGLPDVLMCRGTYPLTPPLPFTPGQEATGTVTAVGDGVDLELGQSIMGVTTFYEGNGSFADECLLLAESSFAVPPGLDDIEAAGFWIPHMTGWIGLVGRGRIAPGDWLAVLGGAGGSGAAAVQLGRALGARVVAVVSDDERAEFCRSLGAEATINHRDGPIAPALRELTGGSGVDLIYDPVGGSLAEEAAGALARNGRLLSVGFASGEWPSLATIQLVMTNSSLVGVFAGGYSRAELETIHAGLAELVTGGQLRTAVTAAIPFDDLATAAQSMADRGVIGKLVLVR